MRIWAGALLAAFAAYAALASAQSCASRTSQWIDNDPTSYTMDSLTNITSLASGGDFVQPWDNTNVNSSSHVGILLSGAYNITMTSQVTVATMTLFQAGYPGSGHEEYQDFPTFLIGSGAELVITSSQPCNSAIVMSSPSASPSPSATATPLPPSPNDAPCKLQTLFTKTTTSGSFLWSDPTAWVPAQADLTNHALITQPGAYTVRITQPSTNVTSLTLFSDPVVTGSTQWPTIVIEGDLVLSANTNCAITTPLAPATPLVQSITNTTLTFTFLPPVAAAGVPMSFNVYVQSTVTTFTTPLVNITYSGSGNVSCLVTGLLASVSYSLYVSASNPQGEGAGSNIVTFITAAGTPQVPPAPAPQPATQTLFSGTSLYLYWPAVASGGSTVTLYSLQMMTNESSTAVAVTRTACDTCTSEQLSGLRGDLEYYFRLRAWNSIGPSAWSPWSNKLMVTGNVPSKPVLFVDSNLPSDGISVRVYWVPPADNGRTITAYNLQVQASGNPNNPWNTVFSGVATEFIIPNLVANAAYNVRLIAVNGVGSSPNSDAVSVTLPAAKPSAPTFSNVSLVADCSAQIGGKCLNFTVVRWSAPLSTGGIGMNIANYSVNLWVFNGGKVSSLSVLPSTLSVDHQTLDQSTLIRGSQYVVYITAWNAYGEGPSASVTFTFPPAPPTPVTSMVRLSVTYSSFVIGWSAPTSSNGAPIVGYSVSYKMASASNWTAVYFNTSNGLSTALSVAFSDLEAFTNYDIAVTAHNAYGSSNENVGTFATVQGPPAQMPPPTITSLDSTHVNISWSQPNLRGGTFIGYELNTAQVFTDGSSSAWSVAYTGTGTFVQLALLANTVYNVRIAATNIIGQGNFSTVLPFRTQVLVCGPGNVSSTDLLACVPCPNGYIGAGGAQDSAFCTKCEAGWYCPTTNSTFPCTLGSYCPAGVTGPQACPAGSFCPTTTNVTACVLGDYCPINSTSAANCPAGSYCASPATISTCTTGYCPLRSTISVICPGGSYCPTPSEKYICPPGNQCPPSSTSALPCSPGYIAPSNASSCSICLAGSYALANGTACVACDRGYRTQFNGLTSCTPCDAGTLEVNRTTCTACPRGQYSGEAGFTGSSCYNCSAGTFAASTGASQCTPCAPGTVSQPGATSCTGCPRGSVPNLDNSACVACEAGTYQSGIYCQPCAPGLVSVANSTSCSSCPSGSIPNSNRTACEKCPAGQYQFFSTCQECSPGMFTSLPGMATCSKCEPGYFNNAYGATGCDPCTFGKFAAGNGSQSCASCSDGSYSAQGSASCTVCGPGFQGNAQHTSCDPCVVGTFNPNNGSMTCGTCPPGTVSGPAASRCISCPAGQVVVAGVCTNCPSGLVPNSLNTSCELCPAGQVSSDPAQGCLPCSTGHIPDTNRTKCVACGPGTYANHDTFTCAPCAAGFISSSGASSCSACPANTISNTNRTACGSCPAGTLAGTGSQADTCLNCTAGSYNDINGGSQCKLCPPGKYSAAGATNCTTCMFGGFAPDWGSDRCISCPGGTVSNENFTSCEIVLSTPAASSTPTQSVSYSVSITPSLSETSSKSISASMTGTESATKSRSSSISTTSTSSPSFTASSSPTPSLPPNIVIIVSMTLPGITPAQFATMQDSFIAALVTSVNIPELTANTITVSSVKQVGTATTVTVTFSVPNTSANLRNLLTNTLLDPQYVTAVNTELNNLVGYNGGLSNDGVNVTSASPLPTPTSSTSFSPTSSISVSPTVSLTPGLSDSPSGTKSATPTRSVPFSVTLQMTVLNTNFQTFFPQQAGLYYAVASALGLPQVTPNDVKVLTAIDDGAGNLLVTMRIYMPDPSTQATVQSVIRDSTFGSLVAAGWISVGSNLQFYIGITPSPLPNNNNPSQSHSPSTGSSLSPSPSSSSGSGVISGKSSSPINYMTIAIIIAGVVVALALILGFFFYKARRSVARAKVLGNQKQQGFNNMPGFLAFGEDPYEMSNPMGRGGGGRGAPRRAYSRSKSGRSLRDDDDDDERVENPIRRRDDDNDEEDDRASRRMSRSGSSRRMPEVAARASSNSSASRRASAAPSGAAVSVNPLAALSSYRSGIAVAHARNKASMMKTRDGKEGVDVAQETEAELKGRTKSTFMPTAPKAEGLFSPQSGGLFGMKVGGASTAATVLSNPAYSFSSRFKDPQLVTASGSPTPAFLSPPPLPGATMLPAPVYNAPAPFNAPMPQDVEQYSDHDEYHAEKPVQKQSFDEYDDIERHRDPSESEEDDRKSRRSKKFDDRRSRRRDSDSEDDRKSRRRGGGSRSRRGSSSSSDDRKSRRSKRFDDRRSRRRDSDSEDDRRSRRDRRRDDSSSSDDRKSRRSRRYDDRRSRR